MSSSANPKPVAEVNLEEFERRLRAAVAPQAGVEDPLAELTRLVDTIGLERTPSQRAAQLESISRPRPKPELRLASPAPTPVARAPEPAAAVAPAAPLAAPAAVAPPPAPRAFISPAPAAPAPRVVAPAAPPPAAVAPPPPAPAPAAKSELPPLADAEPALRPSFDAEDLDSHALEPPAPSLSEDEAAPLGAAPAEPVRASHWGVKIGGLLVAAAVLTGAVVVFKVGGHARSGQPPLILASTAPTKVPPPSDATVRTANENGALLTHDTAQPTPTPPKLVDTPEAPVDLSARPQVSAAPSVIASPSPSAIASPSPSASVAPSPIARATGDLSPVALSSDTPIVASTGAAETPVSPVGEDPSRVKTISVRPDGTLISSGYESADVATPSQATPEPAASAAPAPAPTVAPVATVAPAAPTPAPAPALKTVDADADAEASSPAVELPTKLSPPKSAVRAVAKTATTAPADDGAGPAPVAPKAKKPKAADVEKAKAAEVEKAKVAEAEKAKAAEAEMAKPAEAEKPKPAEVVEATPNTDDAQAPPAADGPYAVQLAAPKTEDDANALIKRLQTRYASLLGGAALGVRKADRHGEPIYRVRALGLSKAAASTMCAKIKASGGDCYVAKN